VNTDFYIGQGDAPLVSETLRDENGAAVDIQGAAVKVTATPVRGVAALLNNVVMQNDQVGDGSDGSRGQVHIQLDGTQTTTPGDYLVKITATKAGQQVTFPNSGFLVWTIGPTAASQQGRYLGIEEYKSTLSLQQLTFADEDIEVAVEAASRGIEEAYGGPWTLRSDGEARYYTRADERTVSLDGAIVVDEVALDYTLGDFFDRRWGYDPFAGGGGTYSTVLSPSDYRLLPVINGLTTATPPGNGEPYTELELVRGARVRRLPSGTDAIRITGQFGWETVPAGVKFSVSLTATRFLRRMREAPFGIVALGLEGAVARVREITSDPDIKMAMNGVSGGRRSLVV
jgi:hypothetical protein